MLDAVETHQADTNDALDRIRRCGTVDTEFFEWLSEQPEPRVDDVDAVWINRHSGRRR
jgi:hypothetical protein